MSIEILLGTICTNVRSCPGLQTQNALVCPGRDRKCTTKCIVQQQSVEEVASEFKTHLARPAIGTITIARTTEKSSMGFLIQATKDDRLAS